MAIIWITLAGISNSDFTLGATHFLTFRLDRLLGEWVIALTSVVLSQVAVMFHQRRPPLKRPLLCGLTYTNGPLM